MTGGATHVRTTREHRNWVALLLVPCGVAVAAGLIALRLHFQPPTVPRYDLVVQGASPGAPGDATPFVVKHGQRFGVALRPRASSRGAVGARAFLLRGDEVRGWDPPSSVTVDGIVRIEGSVDDLFRGVPPGDWEAAIAVGRPEVLPTAPRDVLERTSDDPDRAGWHLVRLKIRLDP